MSDDVPDAPEAIGWSATAAAAEVLRLLPRRLPHGRFLVLAGKRQAVRFEPGDPAWRADGDVLVVSLPPSGCAAFVDRLEARRGAYRWPELPGLEVAVVPSEIRDRDGKVVKVVE